MSSNFGRYVFHEFAGKGKITLKDGTDYSGNFQIYHLNSGNLIGSLWLTRIDSKLNDVINFNETFRFVGQTKSGLKISAERCAIYSTNFQGSDNFPFPLITTRFLIRILNVHNADNLETLREEGTTLYVEVGILNYYSRIKLRLNTEIGEVQFSNRLSDDQITIFQNAHIPDITASLHLKVKGEKTIEATKKKLLKVINKILELTSFALSTEHRWSYYKIYLKEFSDQQFIYSESISRLPVTPNTHNNVEEGQLEDFLSKSYNNYSDHLNSKYNFTLALKWYLDSMALKYDVMKFISASTSLESILNSFATESEAILPRKDFRELRMKIEKVIENELRTRVRPEDLKSMIARLSDINRRFYKKRAERLLESLDLLDGQTKRLLDDIIRVRNRITHSGRFADNDTEMKAAKTYFELRRLLTKVFLKILVPEDASFNQEYGGPWKIVD